MARKGPASEGKCGFCGGVFGKAVMTTHLKSCRRKQAASETARKASKKMTAFHLLVEGRYLPQYWMHLEMRTDASLEVLDQFLRDAWLECCGHMSEFRIENRAYLVMPMDRDEGTMDERLQDVLSPGMVFYHTYDFGSTTYLKLKVFSEWDSDVKRKEVRVLARNEPPEIPCGLCGKPVVHICAECVYSAKGWLCEACAGKHECGDEMFLPVVNSPRVGVCGYTGRDESY